MKCGASDRGSCWYCAKFRERSSDRGPVIASAGVGQTFLSVDCVSNAPTPIASENVPATQSGIQCPTTSPPNRSRPLPPNRIEKGDQEMGNTTASIKSPFAGVKRTKMAHWRAKLPPSRSLVPPPPSAGEGLGEGAARQKLRPSCHDSVFSNSAPAGQRYNRKSTGHLGNYRPQSSICSN